MRIVILIFCILPFWAAADCVVLIHGLGRSDFTFVMMQKILQRHGYKVVVQSYPSTEADLFALAEQTLPRAFDACEADTVHIVTHSMGGDIGAYLAGAGPVGRSERSGRADETRAAGPARKAGQSCHAGTAQSGVRSCGRIWKYATFFMA